MHAALFEKIAGYRPVTDVVMHSRIDLDQEAIEACFSQDNWATCATDMYTNGANSEKSSGPPPVYRTIKGFSTSGSSKFKPLALTTETTSAATSTVVASSRNWTLQMKFHDYFESWTYGDDIMQDFLVCGAGSTCAGVDTTLSRWAGTSGGAAHPVAARKEIVEKASAYINVLHYALYEYYKYGVNEALYSATLDADDLAEGLLHGWEEGWAFFAGSLETGAGTGVLPYVLGEKRASSFGTNDAPNPNGGAARANFKHLAAVQAGRAALNPYDGSVTSAEVVRNAYRCIETQSFVPLVQACLLYTFKAETCDSATADCGAVYGEAYLFCEAMNPLLAAVAPTAATTVSANAALTGATAVASGYTATRNAIYENLNAIGIKCSDVGYCSSCGDDASFQRLAERNGWCNDETVVDSCGPAFPQSDDVPKKNVKKTGGIWKFLAIMMFCIIGSMFIAFLLSLWWAGELSCKKEEPEEKPGSPVANELQSPA